MTVTKRKDNKEEEIRKLTKGEYFGEQVHFFKSILKYSRVRKRIKECYANFKMLPLFKNVYVREGLF